MATTRKRMMNKGISSLAVQGLVRKRRSSLLAFAVLLISFAFAVASLSLVGSIDRTNGEYRLNTYGEWYLCVPAGDESDERWLREQSWTEAIGSSRSYGIINTVFAQAGYGTVDAEFLRIGRIRMDSGRMPTSANEIAMEADLISALGYDYTLGQEIVISVRIPFEPQAYNTRAWHPDEYVTVKRSYTLCGIIGEYTDLWMQSSGSPMLPSAVVTEEAASQTLEAVRAMMLEYVMQMGNTPEAAQYRTALETIDASAYKYFVTVPHAKQEAALAEFTQWYCHERGGEDTAVLCNTSTYQADAAEQSKSLYTYLIAAVALIAVLCVYFMQLPRDVHGFTVLRSLGATKPQLALLMAEETLLLTAPAVLLGIPLGAGLTWIGLRLVMFSGSVAVQVAIPYGILWKVCLLWAAMALFARMVTFLIAVRTPLAGQMQLRAGTSRRMRRLRGALIIMLLAALGFTLVFSGKKATPYANKVQQYRTTPVYQFSRFSNRLDDSQHAVVYPEEVALIRQIPGITRADGLSVLKAEVRFPGVEEWQHIQIYALNEDEWSETFDFSGIREAFHSGDTALLCMPENPKAYGYDNDLPLPEDGIVSIRSDKVEYCSLGCKDLLECYLGVCGNESCALGKCAAVTYPLDTRLAVSVYTVPKDCLNRTLAISQAYTVVCSEEGFRRLLAQMPDGSQWDKYTVGEQYGYTLVLASADENSDNLATDTTVANWCNRQGIYLYNMHEKIVALLQQNRQALIMLYFGGGCIALIALLILGSALALEKEQELRRYRTLRAIGMSARQMRRQVAGKALLRGLLAGAAGSVLYCAYTRISARVQGKTVSNILQYLKGFVLGENSFSIADSLALCAVCAAIVLAVSLLAKRGLKKGASKL